MKFINRQSEDESENAPKKNHKIRKIFLALSFIAVALMIVGDIVIRKSLYNPDHDSIKNVVTLLLMTHFWHIAYYRPEDNKIGIINCIVIWILLIVVWIWG